VTDTGRRQATSSHCQCSSTAHQATSGDVGGVPPKQGVAPSDQALSIAASLWAGARGQSDRSRAISSISTAMSKGSSARPTALRV
jgi:hypothetical protein